MESLQLTDRKLARRLILDELFDLSLYESLRDVTRGETQSILSELIEVEQKHFAFWQRFFDIEITSLDLGRRAKLYLLVGLCRLLGPWAVQIVLEAIEVYGVRKYLAIWDTYKDGSVGEAVRGILEDEFKHEDRVVTGLGEPTIHPEQIRNILLGLNDGLVEILGAVSGFFGAFGNAVTVLVAASTVSVAGAISMGAGAFVASSSEDEVRRTDLGKRRFLGEVASSEESAGRPLRVALVVGISYLVGAFVPVLPVLLGAESALASFITAGTVILVVSMVLAFLSGMNVRRRMLVNLVIMAAAVGITYAIGGLAKSLWGVAV